MNVFKKLLLMTVTAVSVGTGYADAPVETIAGNLKQACPNIVSGIHGLGLGMSRFVLDGSERFAGAGKFCADHYVLSGLGLAGGIYFYTYVWPEVNIDISYSNHRLVHVHHPHARR